MPLVRNRPTPEGRELGAHLARFVDAEAAARPDLPERCRSCALRANTIPNGCPTTVMDALKCVMEREPFFCHERLGPDGTAVGVCAGWWALTTTEGAADRAPIGAAWEFSDEYGEG